MNGVLRAPVRRLLHTMLFSLRSVLLFSLRSVLLFSLRSVLVLTFLPLYGCYLQKKPTDESLVVSSTIQKPVGPEKTKVLLQDSAGNWFYGHGMGSTLIQAGTIVAFPPYALVVLGNAALTLGGYETVGVGSVLPPQQRTKWESFYDGVASGPGRLTSAIAGKEFITRERARDRLREDLQSPSPGTAS